MIDDELRLTVDIIMKLNIFKEFLDKDRNYISPFHIDGYNDSENMYELIGNIQK